MTPEQILLVANDPRTPAFYFGSLELEGWNAKHCYQGVCHTHSGWYVVIHVGHGMPSFRVLSLMMYGQRCPKTYDVPAERVQAA